MRYIHLEFSYHQCQDRALNVRTYKVQIHLSICILGGHYSPKNAIVFTI